MSHRTDFYYRITLYRDGQESITCGTCGMESFNTNDVREHYCGHCHVFHGDRQRSDARALANARHSGTNR
jgi:ribosomal protein L37E